MNQSNNSTIEEILTALYHGSKKHINLPKTSQFEQAEAELNQQALAVAMDLLADENEAEPDKRYDDPMAHEPIQNQEAYLRNQLRAELRTAFTKYYEGEME